MALAIDASSPASVTSTTNTVTTASFTPPANGLVVALASIGNSTGSGTFTGTVSDSISSTWTSFRRQNAAGEGSAEVWIADAGSATARTVTLLGSSGSAQGVQLSVIVFTGAEVKANQPGTSGVVNGSAYTVTLSTAAGSYVVGVLNRSASGVTLTVNGNTTALLSTNDSTNGETYGTFRSSSLTTASANAYGYGNTSSSGNLLVGLEILPSSTTPVSAGDTGSGTEGVSLSVTLSSADTGAGADATSAKGMNAIPDTGAFTETTLIGVSATDTGTGNDVAASVLPSVSASDAGSGADAGSLLASILGGETGTGTEGASVLKNQAVLDGDTGTVTDTLALLGLTLSDSVTAVEQVSLRYYGTFFTTPSTQEHYRYVNRVDRYQDTGITILKTSGNYVAIQDPTAEQVGASDIAYLGGRDYRVDATEAAALTAAGYGSFLSLKEIIS